MDQVLSDRLHETGWESIIAALNNGLILVRTNGEIAWIDEKTRRRVNGGLQNLDLPIQKSDGSGMDCFVTVARVMINGEPLAVCAIQETSGQCEQRDFGHDFIAAIETVMADASRAVVDKLRALRRSTRSAAPPSDLELLSQREREVLALICEGRSDTEMSQMLSLSPNTVRNHIASVFRKIGVNRRSAAIIWARERAITGRSALAAGRHSRAPTSESRPQPGKPPS